MSAPDYPAAVTGYAPDAENRASIFCHAGNYEAAALTPDNTPELAARLNGLADALRVALAVAEANRAAAEDAHWSKPVAPGSLAAAMVDIARTAASPLPDADAPLYSKGQGDFTVEVRP